MSVLSFVTAVGLSRAAAMPLRTTARRAMLSIAALAAVGVAGDRGWDYWRVGRFQLSTDNAYLRADYTTVAPRVSGYVTEVLVRDNQPVLAGQILARIDDRDFKAALDQAKAEVGTTEAALALLDARVAQQQAALEQNKADIAAGKAALAFAKADSQRYGDLHKSGYGSAQRAQRAETELQERTAQLRKSRAAYVSAERQIDVLKSERVRAVAQHARSLAALREAELKLSYTAVAAPVSGTVGARSLRVGQFVQAGTPLMAVVPLDAVYVVANYKETQLAAVRPGQRVTVEIDSFPDQPLEGRVDSVAPASGQEFSLLPADNATGNFTKIVQRVAVRIALDEVALIGHLRPGMSARTTINTRQAARP